MTGIVLAAGKSTRTGTPIPKVLLPLAGRPVLEHVLDTCRAAGIGRTIVIIGWQGDLVRQRFSGYPSPLEFVEQVEQKGTADAVLSCRSVIGLNEDVLVLSGDVPLLQTSTLTSLIARHQRDDADLTLLSAVVDDPRGYGRVVRDATGRILRIVEDRDATPEQLEIKEMNVGLYAFNWGRVLADLERITPSKATGEFYLTQLVDLISARHGCISSTLTAAPSEFMGINTLEEYRDVEERLRQMKGNGQRPTDSRQP
jgi:bifunctional UDP-N-acetylglucosamine pyrophosphorylase/glucosamine-1-phosphate N-acetyltransferase